MSSSVLVGLFESQGAAEQARAQLLSAGFAEAVVSLTGGASSSSPSNPASSQRPAKGTIAHFFESLFGGIATDAEAGHSPYSNNYHEAFQRGSYGVTVTTADDDEIDRAESILNAAGAVDIDEKAAQWRETGAVSSGSAASTAATSLEAGATRKLQEVEEELKVGKRVVARVSPVADVPDADGFPLSQLGDFLARGPQLAADDRQRMAQDVQAVRSGLRDKADPWAS